jgi:ligand-binding SRPBCC domain-containing protein
VFRLKESIHVDAPIERCFLLSTSIEIVRETIKLTPSVKTGLIHSGDMLWWSGMKFGLPAAHQTLITGYDRPNFFQDTMGHGMFKHFQHDHFFRFVDGQTLMWDIVRFSLPFGLPGREIGRRVVVPHVLDLLLKRFNLLKRIAEGDDWERYIPEDADRALAALKTIEVKSGIQPSWR